MSVIVKNLIKRYGAQNALNNISFEAKPGEVLGFLGPNGAGKTTTMKIVTCFIPQTEGTVEVNGYNVEKNAMEVRRSIGYLPEHNPLYKDLYVKEYLSFVAGLHNMKNIRKRVDEMVQITGLEREQKKVIGALSKGYRQRVGLAQAMLHDPQVLILDEPTSGLDPNQLVEIRNLIKQLGRQKTVIFSTHIMQEVQAICDRVVIINKGVIVANDTIETLKNRVKGESVVTVEFAQSVDNKLLSTIAKVKQIKDLGNNRWQLLAPVEVDIRPALHQFVIKHNLTLLEMHKEVSSVEDVFQQLTK